MFKIVSDQHLPQKHPVRLLCHVGKEQASILLEHLLHQTEKQFYEKISEEDSVFVARELTYTARVLTSVGRNYEGIALLSGVLSSFRWRVDQFTIADTYRTLGYAKVNAGMLQEAREDLVLALHLFESIKEEDCEESMFVHMYLSQVYSKDGELLDLASAEYHASCVVDIWKRSGKMRKGIMLVKELHHIRLQREKYEEAQQLRLEYPTYFDGDDSP